MFNISITFFFFKMDSCLPFPNLLLKREGERTIFWLIWMLKINGWYTSFVRFSSIYYTFPQGPIIKNVPIMKTKIRESGVAYFDSTRTKFLVGCVTYRLHLCLFAWSFLKVSSRVSCKFFSLSWTIIIWQRHSCTIW